MPKRLFPILAGISLALAIGAMGLCGVSYWLGFGVQHLSMPTAQGVSRYNGINARAGGLRVFRGQVQVRSGAGSVQSGWGWHWYRRYPLRAPVSWTRELWFAQVTQRTPGVRLGEVHIPLWFPTLLFLILPAVWLRRFRSERRKQREGLCRQCGYDLRAHSPGQVCPECGTTVPADLVRKPMEQTP